MALVRPVHPARTNERRPRAGFLTLGSLRSAAFSKPEGFNGAWRSAPRSQLREQCRLRPFGLPDFPIKPFRAPVASPQLSLRNASGKPRTGFRTCAARKADLSAPARQVPRKGIEREVGCLKTRAAPATVSGEPPAFCHWDQNGPEKAARTGVDPLARRPACRGRSSSGQGVPAERGSPRETTALPRAAVPHGSDLSRLRHDGARMLPGWRGRTVN